MAGRRKPTPAMIRALRWLDGSDVPRPQQRTLDALVADGWAETRPARRPVPTSDGYDLITYAAQDSM